MIDYQSIIDKVIETEGGYVNDPADSGGPTKYGITQNTLSSWIGRRATVEDVKAISTQTASEIYASEYYFKPRIDQMPEDLQYLALDTSVLHGPYNTVKMIQNVINASEIAAVHVDGVAGPQTLKALGEVYAEMQGYLINAVVDERIAFYEKLVARKPSQKKFLQGWTNRANKFRVRVD